MRSSAQTTDSQAARIFSSSLKVMIAAVILIADFRFGSLPIANCRLSSCVPQSIYARPAPPVGDQEGSEINRQRSAYLTLILRRNTGVKNHEESKWDNWQLAIGNELNQKSTVLTELHGSRRSR